MTDEEGRVREAAGPPGTETATPPARRGLRYLLPCLTFALALAAALLCRAAAGPHRGTFFGGTAFAALLVPPLVLIESSFRRQALVTGAVVIGVAVGWLVSVFAGDVSPGPFAQAGALLAAFALALWGLAALLARLRIASPLASALVTLLALAWLAWPVWLSPALPGRDRLADALTSAHPLLALDALLLPWEDSWATRQLFYFRLGNLNQDVRYNLPPHAAAAVVVHAALGAVALTGAWVKRGSPGSEPL